MISKKTIKLDKVRVTRRELIFNLGYELLDHLLSLSVELLFGDDLQTSHKTTPNVNS